MLSAELEGGVIFSQDGTRITDRFNTGGDSFRGFARNGLGPRDFCDDSRTAPTRRSRTYEVNDALGGNYYAVAPARRELPARPAAGVRHLRRRLRRRRLALGARRHRRQHGRGRRRLPHPLVGGRQPLRRHALRAAALQLRHPARSTRTTTSSSGSASPSRPGSEPCARGRSRSACALALALALAASRPGAGRRWRPAAPFLIINQERLLTGSKAGQAILAEEERQRDTLRSRGARARRLLRGGGAAADRAAPDAAAGGVPQALGRLRRPGRRGAPPAGRAGERAGAGV